MTDVLGKIAQKRARRVQDLHLDLPVPTWDKDMIFRFNVIDRSTVNKLEDKGRRNTQVDAEFISSALREIYVYDPGHEANGDRMPEEPDGHPLRIDPDDYVRVEHDSGGPILLQSELISKIGQDGIDQLGEIMLFLTGGNGVAVAQFANRIAAWTGNTDAQVARDLVGE